MTADEFNGLLKLLGWSLRELARRLDCNITLVQRWGSGGAPIPAPVGSWLYRLHYAQLHVGPCPPWRSR